ncbi:MAG: hypothetical protein GY757_21080 [bacterium]|nr:hypothetical protein [bacterium]
MKTVCCTRKAGILIICILALFFFQILDAQQHVGKWRWEAQGKVFELLLNANGTGALSGQAFNYRIQGNQLLVTYPNGSSETMSFVLAGNSMTLTFPNGATAPFQRMGGAGTSTTSSPSSYVSPASAGAGKATGTWSGVVNGKQIEMNIKPGGSMVFAGQRIPYVIRNGQLVVTMGGQQYTYGMQVSANGSQLTLAGADIGGTVTFTRTGGGGGLTSLTNLPGPNPPASSPASPPSTPALPTSKDTSSSTPPPAPVFPPAAPAFPKSNSFPAPAKSPQVPESSSAPGDVSQNMAFDTYTFKSDPTVKIAYPRGWTVTENQYGASIVEKQTADTAGVEIMVLQLQPHITTNQMLAQSLLDNLRQQMYPDLKVLQQGPHPRAPQVLNIYLTYSSKGIGFQALSWCAVNVTNRVGVFATFYAPGTRFLSFNAQQVLVSCMAPMLGGTPQ